MIIRWKGSNWNVKYYPDGYARWTLENGNTSVSWLQNKEQYFTTQDEFIKFLRERENGHGYICEGCGEEIRYEYISWKDADGRNHLVCDLCDEILAEDMGYDEDHLPPATLFEQGQKEEI